MPISNAETILNIKLIREYCKLGMQHVGNIDHMATEIVKIIITAQVNRDNALLQMIFQQLFYIAPENGDGE